MADEPSQLAKMHAHGFRSIKMDGPGQIKSCTIDAPNLWGAIKDGALPPCETLMVSVTPSSTHELVDCAPEAFRGIGTLALSATPVSDVESRLGLGSPVIEWLGKLPVKYVAVNASGFAPQTIDAIQSDPKLALKLAVVENSNRGPMGLHDFSPS